MAVPTPAHISGVLSLPRTPPPAPVECRLLHTAPKPQGPPSHTWSLRRLEGLKTCICLPPGFGVDHLQAPTLSCSPWGSRPGRQHLLCTHFLNHMAHLTLNPKPVYDSISSTPGTPIPLHLLTLPHLGPAKLLFFGILLRNRNIFNSHLS